MAEIHRARDSNARRERSHRAAELQGCPGRQIPSFAMRVSSVVGRSPSRSAAPPDPRTRQPLLSRTLRICSLATSASATLCFLPGPAGAGREMVNCVPVATIIARSTTLRSSRMLPGQE